MKHSALIAIIALATAQAIALDYCKPAVESAAQELNKKSKEFEPLLSEENSMIHRSRVEKRPVDLGRFAQMTNSLNTAKLELCSKFEDSYEEKDSCLIKDSSNKEIEIKGESLLKDCKDITKVSKPF